MKRIEFSATFDENSESLTPEMVKDLIFNRSLDDWEASSSGSSITYNGETTESQITIFAHQEYGFMLLYDDGTEKTQVLTEGQNKEVVTFSEGYTSCFRNQLVSREAAWKAIEYFMQTGKRLHTLNWQEYEVPEVV